MYQKRADTHSRYFQLWSIQNAGCLFSTGPPQYSSGIQSGSLQSAESNRGKKWNARPLQRVGDSADRLQSYRDGVVDRKIQHRSASTGRPRQKLFRTASQAGSAPEVDNRDRAGPWRQIEHTGRFELGNL